MSQMNPDETHQNLLSRIPAATGRELCDWFAAVDQGPALLRFDEKVNWLRTEHDLPHGYAKAIVHEHDLRRAARNIA